MLERQKAFEQGKQADQYSRQGQETMIGKAITDFDCCFCIKMYFYNKKKLKKNCFFRKKNCFFRKKNFNSLEKNLADQAQIFVYGVLEDALPDACKK